MSRLIGIILAAGESSRMGRPKALLTCPSGGVTFVTRAIRTMRTGGVAGVAVIARPGDAALQQEIAAHAPAVPCLENGAPELGQLSSVLVGVSYAEQLEADGVMVLPVDIPSVGAATIRALLAAFDEGLQPLVRPAHRSRHGHPVIFARSLFPELRAADPSVGARAVFRRDPARVRQVDVDDPGVLRDIDYPDDYRRLLREPD
jgi:molybdenum cofactor cytidylyltransferase